MDTLARIAELEGRLRRIADEVRAAGLLGGPSDEAKAAYPDLRELSPRQAEIVRRMLDGERVPTIAEKLYLSPSTVRNHLTAVFRQYKVHSQAELVALLHARRAARADEGVGGSDGMGQECRAR